MNRKQAKLIAWTILTRKLEQTPAPCQTRDPEIWQDPRHIVKARKYCSRCKAQFECATYAITAQEPEGIWGGLTPPERKRNKRPEPSKGIIELFEL